MKRYNQIKNLYKTERSSTRGGVIGLEDPLNLNRVKVYIPTIHGSNILNGQWCVCGLYDKPDIGDIVIVTFDNDDTRVPMVTANITKSMQGGSNSNTTYTAFDASTASSNGDYIQLIGNIIKTHECGSATPDIRHYGCIVASDNGSLSIGLIGWHEDEARKLCKQIKEKDPTKWKELVENRTGDFKLQRTLEVTWGDGSKGTGFVPKGLDINSCGWDGTEAHYPTKECRTFFDILNTDSAKEVQEQGLKDYISSYIENAVSLGITDMKCIMYYCDFANQGCGLAMSVVRGLASGSTSSLDKFHNAIMNRSAWPTDTQGNRNRRTKTYEMILEMEANGEFDKFQSGTADGTLLWPAPGYPVVRYGFALKNYPEYDHWHGGVDINSEGRTASVEIANQPCIASCNGTITCTYSGPPPGKCIHLHSSDDDKMHVYYMHLSSYADGMSVGSTKTVKAGEVIGYVGNADGKYGYHLHFEVRYGGTSDGARTETDHGYCVDPELYLLPDGQKRKSTVELTDKIGTGDISKGAVAKTGTTNDGSIECLLFNYVSKEASCSRNYNPMSLTVPTQANFERMKNAAGEDYKKYFEIVTGFRSYEKQNQLFQRVGGVSQNTVSAPGHSEHQLGEAVDVYSTNLADWETPEAAEFIEWLQDHAYEYGFIIRYPNVEGREYDYKPWHLRYVGKDIATEVQSHPGGLIEEIMIENRPPN